MRSNFLKTIAALSLCIILQGCATIISGGSQKVIISSDPTNAKIKIYNKSGYLISSSTTPQAIRLNRGRGFFSGETYKIVITKENYETKEIIVDSRFNGWYLGNIFCGGPIGFLFADPISGAMWTLHPDMVSAELTKKLNKNDEMQLKVALISSVPKNLRSKLQPINV